MVTLNHQRVVSEYVALTLMKIKGCLPLRHQLTKCDVSKLLLLVQRFHQSNVTIQIFML